MDIKGAILNLSTIRSIYGIIDSFDYSDGFLTGVDGFNLNPLKGFKEEFPSVIKAVKVLDNSIFANHNLSDNHEFVMHFENDVAEMDCATFLTINDKPFFVDIEVKETDHVDQLIEQFEQREKDSLVQLNFSDNYLLIGFLNGSFNRAIINSNGERKEVFSIDGLKEVTNGLTNKAIDLKLIFKDLQGILKIQDVNNKIASNDFKYFSATKDAIDSVSDNIYANKKVIIIYGNAGSGKTVVALSLFYKYKNVKLLVLNKNLYSALSLYRYYQNGTCFYGTDAFINSLDEDCIAVVDECQRLSVFDIERIISKAKVVVLLGDNNQAFTNGDSLLNEEELKTTLIMECDLQEDDISTKRMKKTARYNSRVNKLLEVLHNNSPLIGSANEIKDKVGDEYVVDITMAESEFVHKYEGSTGSSRFYMPFVSGAPDSIVFYNKEYRVAGKDDVSFSIINYYLNFIGNTFHAISFDVDNSFVILKNVGLFIKNNEFFFYDKRCNPDLLTISQLKKYNNQINILFTRGRKSLHIFTDDFYVFSYLNYKIKRGIK